MIPLVLVALIGAPVTAALMWSHGVTDAVLAAPFSGSLAALGVAILLGWNRSASQPPQAFSYARVGGNFGAEWHASTHG